MYTCCTVRKLFIIAPKNVLINIPVNFDSVLNYVIVESALTNKVYPYTESGFPMRMTLHVKKS